MKKHLVIPIAILSLAAALPSHAEIYTLPDFTRTAGETANNDVHFDFDPNDGWSGTPPNAISNETSLYLKFTVSWAPTTDLGSFLVRFNVFDDGAGARIGAGTDGSGFALINGNAVSDGDGAGPATVRPTVDSVDKEAVTSATFVLKVDQTKPSPGGDWWFGDTTQQDGANQFLYINPDLGMNEALQSTKWAAWRSGQNNYQGVTFRTNTNAVDLNFTDIALYTGDDTPFSTAVGGVDADTSTVTATPTSIPANGITTSTVTVTVKDAGGIPLADKLVSLANTAGPGAPDIDPATDTTDFFGVATFTVNSTTVGTEEFTATADSVPITQTASVDFVSAVTDAGTSTVEASPDKIAADGAAESIVTVTLRNSLGMPLPGKLVSLANTSGPGTPTINPAESGSDTSDADGVATFVVTSDTIGTEEFTATDTTDAVVVTQTASVEFADPTIQRGFNVSFAQFTPSTGSFEDPASLVGPAGGLGESWSQFAAASGSNLIASDGTATSVGVTTNFTEGRYDGTGATPMLRATLTDFARGTARTFTITGLPPGALYDVWLTSFRNQASAAERTYGRWTANNPTTSSGVQFIDNRDGQNGTTFVEGYNYVVFTGVVADESGQISFDGKGMTLADDADADYRLGLSGFQIAPAAGPPPPTTTLVIDLGEGTEILGGQFIGSGPTNLPIPELPVGSILRSIEMDVALEATDNDNFASDLAVLLDPTPEAPGGDFSVEITNGTSPFGATVSLGWSSGDAGPVTPLTDTKTAADWAAVSPIDLATTGLFLGNAFGSAPAGGTWSGTITLTYDVVSPATEYENWAGGEPFDDDKNGDGVDNGIAFLLGADNPDDNANGLLPAASNDGSGLVLEFSMLNSDNRGDASLTLQWSSDLGVTDLWENNEAVVPDESGTVNGVGFIITPGDPTNAVEATIPDTEGAGGKLFGRLSGSEN